MPSATLTHFAVAVLLPTFALAGQAGEPPRVDFQQILAQDSLVSDPPPNIDLSLEFVGVLDDLIDAWGWILRLGRAPERR